MLKECRKSQITIFIIIAIVLIGLISGIFYLSHKSPTTSKVNSGNAFEDIISQRDNCIETLTKQALDYYGLDQNKMTDHLNSNFLNCLIPVVNNYKDQYQISYSVKKISCIIDSEKIKISLDMPLQVTKGNEVKKSEGKEWINLRTISQDLETDSNCILKKDAGLVSFDGKFRIDIPNGTKATNSDGSCLKSIDLTLIDPKTSYGGREKSYTAIAYVAGPLGARFEGDVTIKQEYSSKDYNDYVKASIDSRSYVVPQNWIKNQYYDKNTQNFYVHPGETKIEYNDYTARKVITTKINQFFNGNLITNSDCITLKDIIVESTDKRMRAIVDTGIKAVNSDESCITKVAINNLVKSSVSTFGPSDYKFLPAGAKFSPDIKIVYRYTQIEASDPTFLYGKYNWKELINGNWTKPNLTQMISANIAIRQESDLRLAFLDGRVFNPFPTIVDTKNKEVIGSVGHFSTIATKTNCEDGAYGRWTNVVTAGSAGSITFTLENEYSCAHLAIASSKLTDEGDTLVSDPILPRKYLPSEATTQTITMTLEDTNQNGEGAADLFVELWGGGLTVADGTTMCSGVERTTANCFNYLTDGEYCWFNPEANKCAGAEWSEEYCMQTYSGLELEGCLACVRMAAADGNPEGKTLDYCTHAVIGEGTPVSVSYTPASCSSTGSYKSGSNIIGYGAISNWESIDAEELANQLSTNGLNTYYIEVLANPYDSSRQPSRLLPILKNNVEAMRDKNITTMINLVHGKLNDGEGDYICKNAFNDTYFTTILDYVITNIGSEKVILEANHEWVGGCQDRRNSQINILGNSNWTGERAYYETNTPRSNWYMTVHPSPGSNVPAGSVVVMDGGDILRMTSIDHNGWVEAVPEKLEAYARSVMGCGGGIIYYGYGQTFIDSGAIQALGKAKSGV